MSTYLDIALGMARNPTSYELREFDGESPPARSKAISGPVVNSSNSSNSYSPQLQRQGWNPVLRCHWKTAYWCSCGASVGGEYSRCPLCGAPRPANEVAF